MIRLRLKFRAQDAELVNLVTGFNANANRLAGATLTQTGTTYTLGLTLTGIPRERADYAEVSRRVRALNLPAPAAYDEDYFTLTNLSVAQSQQVLNTLQSATEPQNKQAQDKIQAAPNAQQNRETLIRNALQPLAGQDLMATNRTITIDGVNCVFSSNGLSINGRPVTIQGKRPSDTDFMVVLPRTATVNTGAAGITFSFAPIFLTTPAPGTISVERLAQAITSLSGAGGAYEFPAGANRVRLTTR